MKTATRLKTLIATAFALAFAASLLGGAGAGAQQKARPAAPQDSSFSPVVEEPFDVVRARDKAARQRVMARQRASCWRNAMTCRGGSIPTSRCRGASAIPVGPTARLKRE